MGRVRKGVACSVEGCENRAIRSISYANFLGLNLGFSVKTKEGRVYLCKAHYKEFKKASRKARSIEKWRWMR